MITIFPLRSEKQRIGCPQQAFLQVLVQNFFFFFKYLFNITGKPIPIIKIRIIGPQPDYSIGRIQSDEEQAWGFFKLRTRLS